MNSFLILLTMLFAPSASIYDFKVEGIDGTTIDLSQFKGKKLLIVNTASKCGYTPQYEGLQKLHELYGDKLTILGFPSNNFMGQEPGTNLEIMEFCKANYGVTFRLFSKIEVKGKNQHPLYAWLSDKDKNGWNDKAPSWNFCKYLIDENGKLVHFYKSGVKPMDQKIIDFING
ncbi:MAG: glutathione peroxidase [Bacteroidota bacterium]